MRGGESGASIVQVCVPEFKSVDFRGGEEKEVCHRYRRGYYKQNELREVLEKT